MILFPEAQEKAHEEIDRVIGERLPEWEDRENLPYIHCVVKESFWCGCQFNLSWYKSLADSF
jgi:hypothetical protein